MKTVRIDIIHQCIESLSFVSITSPFIDQDSFLNGEVSISFDELEEPLSFKVEIQPQYPFKTHDSETIKFKNSDLLPFKHVMGDGTICIHTSHSINLEEKLGIDFLSLKNWITKYYINKEEEEHYEHLITSWDIKDGHKFAFLFTNVDYQFKKGDFGFINQKILKNGQFGEAMVNNLLTDSFTNQNNKKLVSCKWSSFYQNITHDYHGLYVFVEDSPSLYNRFLYGDWNSFHFIFQPLFLNFLHHCEKEYLKKRREGQVIPLYIGYRIPNREIHWQVAILEVGKFPIEGVRENKKWYTQLTQGKITWGTSRNSSYSYFFGRGAFSENITQKKILMIGTGAIGSMVARTLVKSGCLKIDLCDYDIKEPANICRAEFQFSDGLTSKVKELVNNLSQISPFVEIVAINQLYLEKMSKVSFSNRKSQLELEEYLNTYDIIFDCTTDNDLMYILNELNLSCDLINLSITNKAKELVCAFYPNIYDFVTTQFGEILDYDREDLYNPTGCWNPTFKASYNDINLLVQYALKYINSRYQQNLPKNNFVIKTGCETDYKLELKEF